MKKSSMPAYILALTSLIGIVLIAYLATHQPQQCPEMVSQAQIDETHCIIGADIGTGFGIFIVGLVWAISTIAVLAWLVIRYFWPRKM